MNKSEENAVKWLKANFRLKDDQVHYDPENSTITTRMDRRKWVVKRLYGGKTAVFYRGDMDRITQDRDNTLLLLMDDKLPAPAKEIPARILMQNKEGYAGFKFKHVETDISANPGEIAIKLSRRTDKARYYRAGHVPIESLLTWQHGEYNLRKSVEHGKLDFFLIMRPDVLET